MKRIRRGLGVCVIVAIYAAMCVIPASAHADLVRSNPASNAVLAEAPAQVELIFSEPLEAQTSTVKVYDANGDTIDLRDATVDPAYTLRLTVSLPTLPDGVYTVAWQVVSRYDGHATAGSFPFAVGDVQPASLPSAQESTGDNLPVSGLIAKWLLLAACALLAGGFVSRTYVWGPAMAAEAGEQDRFRLMLRMWDDLDQYALIALGLACILGVLTQAGQASGRELAAPWEAVTGVVLTQTRLGLIWLTRFALGLAAVWMIRSASAGWRDVTRFVIGLALLLSISLTSHAAAEPRPLLPVAVDWLHLVGMAFWFAGLAHIISGLAVLRGAEGGSRARVTAAVASHFSDVALPSVVILGLTGLYSASLRLGSVSALLQTTYGHVMLVKQVLVLGLLLMAGVNFLMLSPGMRRDSRQGVVESPSVRRFGRTVLVEVILADLLLASVSVLTYLPPARTPAPPARLAAAASQDDLHIAFSASPGWVGRNTFTVQVSPAKTAQAVTSVLLSFVSLDENISQSDFDLTAQGAGVYSGEGANLGFPGHWLVVAAVRRAGRFDAVTTFDFQVEKPPASTGSEVTTMVWISRFLMLAIVLLMDRVLRAGRV